MDDIEGLIEALRALYAHLEKLKSIEGPELLLPGRIDQYQRLLDDAYAAYSRVETAVDELGQELEYEHTRLDNAAKKYGE